MSETKSARRYPLLTPAVRRRVVEIVATYGYNEWRVGRYHHGDYRPMWHELSVADREKHIARAKVWIGDALPTKAKSRRS